MCLKLKLDFNYWNFNQLDIWKFQLRLILKKRTEVIRGIE